MALHNYVKPKRITDKNNKKRGYHYSLLGMDIKKVNHLKQQFTEKRFFIQKINLPLYYEKIWFRKTDTPFGDNRYAVPMFAYQ